VDYLTISVAGAIDPARKAEVDDAAARRGAQIVWREHVVVNRSYASIAAPSRIAIADIPVPSGDTIYEGAIIALAVFPTVPEALPVLVEALSGPGGPASVLACHGVPNGLIVEWDPQRCPVEVILGTIDVELRRFSSGRTAELLSPLPAEAIAAVAARGLQTPQITTRRILEMIVET
jgi:hypothetical protein